MEENRDDCFERFFVSECCGSKTRFSVKHRTLQRGMKKEE